ncbi:glycosyltransferase family 4 protein [Hymenobacter defluvii]|uniref:Glycosyltransferase family 4 protein n=1 Tax=Hymenobacter defluvii TaxID=2054411 RepID=A0ABS3T6S4_9BACT|nr:glycosyltransferase family 4 protein [Hymenobacter defluvii]MBO3269347.1 glycosyltransferase family 4 protein [Hymenobacter defluvii]
MSAAGLANAPTPVPLTILCLSASWGGLEINTVKLAGWLLERGWPVELIGLAGSPLAAQAQRQGVPICYLSNPLRAVDVPAAWRLRTALRRHGARVLIVTQNQDLPLAVLCKRWRAPHVRLVYQQHMQLGLAKRDLLHTLRYRALDAWLTPLPGLAQQVGEKTHMDMRRVHVVPLGIELERFLHPGLTTQQAREELQLPATGQLLGLIGRFDEGKGQQFVVEAFHQLRRQFPEQELHLVLVGEVTKNNQPASHYRATVLDRIRELELMPYVHIRDFTDQPQVAYRALDVFLVASVNETYGMVTIEAMAAGLPIVATEAGGTPEILVNDETGILYPLGDTQAWLTAVAWCLQQPAQAKEMGLRAQQTAIRTYSHHQQCALTEGILYQLL